MNVISNLNKKEEEMLTPEQVREKLAESNLMAVSKAAGVHSNSLYRFMSCGTRPSYELIVKLTDYIEQKEKGEKEWWVDIMRTK